MLDPAGSAQRVAPRRLRRYATTEKFRHDENLAIAFRDCCLLFGAGRGPLGAAAGSLLLAIFSLFWRFKFPVPQTAGNLARKSFELLGNSPLAPSRDALKMLGNLKNRRVISLFSGNFRCSQGISSSPYPGPWLSPCRLRRCASASPAEAYSWGPPQIRVAAPRRSKRSVEPAP